MGVCMGLVRTYSKGILAYAGSRIELTDPSDEEAGASRVSVKQLIYGDQIEPYVMMYQMGCTQRGAIRVVTPNTRPTLAMFEPMALPTASSPDPAIAAVIDTRISGAEVPRDTMVRPMMIGDMPMLSAMEAAPATNRSALQMRMMKPTRMVAAAKSIGT